MGCARHAACCISAILSRGTEAPRHLGQQTVVIPSDELVMRYATLGPARFGNGDLANDSLSTARTWRMIRRPRNRNSSGNRDIITDRWPEQPCSSRHPTVVSRQAVHGCGVRGGGAFAETGCGGEGSGAADGRRRWLRSAWRAGGGRSRPPCAGRRTGGRRGWWIGRKRASRSGALEGRAGSRTRRKNSARISCPM